MKFKKKTWYITGGITGIFILTLLFFSFMLQAGSIESLKPEDYKDNPELQKLVKDIKDGKHGTYLYPIKKIEDPRFFDICKMVIEDEPSYYEFINKKLALKDIKTLFQISRKWNLYCLNKTARNGFFIKTLSAYGKEDKRIYPILIEHLNSEWPQYRYYAAETLGSLGGKRAVEPLITLLKEKDNKVFIGKGRNSYIDLRCFIADALGKLGDKQAVQPLLMILKTEKSLPSSSKRSVLASAIPPPGMGRGYPR